MVCRDMADLHGDGTPSESAGQVYVPTTRLTATVRYPSLQVRDMVIASGMANGAGISYDRLEDLFAELQR